MKLQIKNNLFSLGGGSVVLDENGQVKYKVKGKWPSITKKKKIKDMDGNLLYVVKNKIFQFINRVCYIYDNEKQLVAEVKENQYDFQNKFLITSFSDEIEFSRAAFQFPRLSLEVKKNGKVIGEFSRDVNFWRDSYTLKVETEEDEALFVALVIAIDNIFDQNKKNK